MPPEPNDQMVTEPELGDEELQQWLTSVADGADIQLPGLDIGIPASSRKPVEQLHTGEQQTGGAPDDDEPDPDDDDEPEPGTQTPAPTDEDDYVTINGNQFAKSDIERLYNFDQYMRANPDVAQRVNDAITTRPTPEPTGTGEAPVSETPTDTDFKPPEPPEFLDLEDPVHRFQWESHVSTLRAIHDRDQRDNKAFAQMAADRKTQQDRQAAADMRQALDTFTQAHPNLNDDDIAKIRQAAAPFVEGMLKQLPPVEALARSMEVAAVMDNDIRDKMMDPTVKTRTEGQRSHHRKQRLGQIAGSPRSAPRTEPTRPAHQSDKEFLNALAAEFSEHMQR